jgi:hypothetical protein
MLVSDWDPLRLLTIGFGGRRIRMKQKKKGRKGRGGKMSDLCHSTLAPVHRFARSRRLQLRLARRTTTTPLAPEGEEE